MLQPAYWGTPNWGNWEWGIVPATTPPKFEPSQWVAVRDRSGKGGGGLEVSPWLVWAICPRCGFRYKLAEMREEIYDQKPTGRRVCPECWDQDDPHLALYRMDLDDVGWVRDPLPQSGHNDSVSYASALFPVQWDLPIECKLGPFFIYSGDENITAPFPPIEFGAKTVVPARCSR